MTDKKLKYSTTRFAGDKFVLYVDFTNQNMLDIPAGYDISGSLVRKSGQFCNIDIQTPQFQDGYVNGCIFWYYGIGLDMIHISSKGDLKAEH